MTLIMDNGREKTYLLILSFIIIANLFVKIKIDTINILGNEATVDNWFIGLTVFLMWVYFLWIFYQMNKWRFKERLTSQTYLRVLHNNSSHLIDKYAKKKKLYIDKDQILDLNDPNFNILSFMDATPTDAGFRIPIERKNNLGEFTRGDSDLIIPYSETSWAKANIAFIINDASFSQFTFPYIMALLAGISIILTLLGVDLAPAS